MKRFLRFASESVYATRDGSPAFTCYDPQDGAGAFKAISGRPMWNIQDNAQNIPRIRGSEVYSVAGAWSGRIYWENYKIALWPLRVNSAQTSPWATDQRPGDLASATIDFGYSYYDLTVKRKGYLGCKIGSGWEFSCSNDPSNPHLMFRYDVVGSKPITNAITADTALDSGTFPEPTNSDIPVLPLSFYQCVFTSQGAAIPYFDRFSIRGAQKMKPYYDSTRFVNRVSHTGRVVTLTAHMRLDVANDPRTRYEAITALGTTTLVFTKPGAANTLTMNFRSKTYLDQVDEEMPMDDDAYSSITATAYLDTTPGDDFTITYA